MIGVLENINLNINKIKYILLIISLSQGMLFSQQLNLTPKYSFNFNSDYSTHQLSLEGLFQFSNNKFELGGILGLVNMEYKDHKWEKAINDVYKLFYGIRGNFYPFYEKFTKYCPYVGLKIASVYDRPLRYGGGMMIFNPGYYYPNAKNDIMTSIILGVKLNTHFILEFEFEIRKFDYKYSEYYYNDKSYLVSREHQSNISTKTIQLNFGYSINF